MTPSAFKSRKACSSSARAPTTSGKGKVTKFPNRSGRLATSDAVYSLTRLARSRRLAPEQPVTPGAVSDRIPIAIPCESIKSIAFSGVQAGLDHPEGSPPCAASASAQNGGTTCWWTSMRPVLISAFFISLLRIGIAGSQDESGNEDLAPGRGYL